MKPTDAVAHMYDVRNSPDLLTGLFHSTGDLVNGRPTDNYTLIREQEVTGWRTISGRGGETQRVPIIKDNWQLPASSILGLNHTWADSYMPAMDYLKQQNQSGNWGLK